jgi:hypothetical protein
MNEVELLALGDALARTSDVLRPGEHVPFRDYLVRVFRSERRSPHCSARRPTRSPSTAGRSTGPTPRCP